MCQPFENFTQQFNAAAEMWNRRANKVRSAGAKRKEELYIMLKLRAEMPVLDL